MARPTRTAITSGQQAWDSVVNDDFKLVFNRPFALCMHATNESTVLTESNVATSYTASSYADCYVWVNHSVRGMTLARLLFGGVSLAGKVAVAVPGEDHRLVPEIRPVVVPLVVDW